MKELENLAKQCYCMLARFYRVFNSNLSPKLLSHSNLIPHRHISTFDRLVDNRQAASSVSSLVSSKPVRTLVMDRTGDDNFGLVLRGHSPVVVESVDPDGSAAKVGLRPGDRLLKLNGLDVSRCSHSRLVQLLQGSGSRPTLEVMQGPAPNEGKFLLQSANKSCRIMRIKMLHWKSLYLK